MASPRSKSALFWGLALGFLVVDQVTKYIAVEALSPSRVPHPVFGEWFRFTLVYNRGAAFGLNVGDLSRIVFITLTLVALVILWRLYVATPPADRLRTAALGLVTGGAVGNLLDRLRSPLGVVDFLDIGVGDLRWPTFNVADIAVSVGAFLLAWALWGEEEREELANRAAAAAQRGPASPERPGA